MPAYTFTPAVLRFANDLARTVELNRRTAPVSERVERKVATANLSVH